MAGVMLLHPVTELKAQSAPQPAGGFRNITFSGTAGGFWIFNHNTGEIFLSENPRPGAEVRYVGKLVEPGKPLAP